MVVLHTSGRHDFIRKHPHFPPIRLHGKTKGNFTENSLLFHTKYKAAPTGTRERSKNKIFYQTADGAVDFCTIFAHQNQKQLKYNTAHHD